MAKQSELHASIPKDYGLVFKTIKNVFFIIIFSSGGVTTFTKQQFLAVNGYSNEYWGWGAEDDDLSNRVRTYYRLEKVPRPENKDNYHIYKIPHKRDANNQKNKNRFTVLQ